MFPLDIPYINLFFHKECFRLAGGYAGITVEVTQFPEMVYNSIITSRNGDKIGKNGRKTQTIEKPASQHEAI